MPYKLPYPWLFLLLIITNALAGAAENDNLLTLRGQVVDAQQAPVAHATVRISIGGGKESIRDRQRSDAITVRTDELGKFEASPRRWRSYVVRVEAGNLAPAELTDYRPVGRNPFVEIQLPVGRTIVGSVAELASSEDVTAAPPIPGATVFACGANDLLYGIDACRRGVTDDDGRFRLEHLSEDSLVLYAYADGRALVSHPLDSDNEPRLLLPPGQAVRGQVLDEDEKTVAGVIIRIAMKTDDGPEVMVWPASSDEEGKFNHPGLAAGTFRFVAHPGDRVASSETVELLIDPAGEPAAIELRIVSTPTLSFRLIDPEGRPVSIVPAIMLSKISAEPTARKSYFYRQQESFVSALDGGGNFEVRSLPRTRFGMIIRPTEWADVEIPDLVSEPGIHLDLGDLLLERGASIRGRVTDAASAPIPDVEVRAQFIDSNGANERSGHSDRSGRYVIYGLTEKPVYALTANAEGYSQGFQQQVKTDGDDVDFKLDVTTHVIGRVLDQAGEPVISFEVALLSEASMEDTLMPSFNRTNKPEAFVDDEGRFDYEASPGLYTVQVDTAETAPARVSGVQLAPGQIVDVGDLTLPTGLVVRGRVLGPTGHGIAKATVGIKSDGTLGFFSRGGEAVNSNSTTDEDGRFELLGMLAGRVTLSAKHEEFSTTTQEIELIDDEPTPDVVLTLERGGELSGTVTDAKGQPRVGTSIMLYQSLRNIMSQRLIGRTDSDGRYNIKRIPTGSYEVICMFEEGDFQNRTSGNVAIENDRTTTYDCSEPETGIMIRGRVLQANTALPDRSLMLIRGDITAVQSLNDIVQIQTDEAGLYEARVNGPGQYQAAIVGGVSGGTMMTAVEVPSGVKSATVDILFADGRITGRVRKADGADVARIMVQAIPLDEIAPRATTGTDAEGRFELTGLPANDYRVTAMAPGYRLAETSPVVAGQGTVENVELLLEASDVLRLLITDPDGNPAAGAIVLAMPSGMAGVASANAQSDVNGRVRLGAPTDGSMDVIAGASGWAITTIRGVQAQTTEEEPEIILLLTRGGDLSVTVVDGEGDAVASQVVMVKPLVDQPGFPMRMFLEPHPATNAAGVTLIRRLSAGQYHISVGEASMTVEILEGGQTTATLRLP